MANRQNSVYFGAYLFTRNLHKKANMALARHGWGADVITFILASMLSLFYLIAAIYPTKI